MILGIKVNREVERERLIKVGEGGRRITGKRRRKRERTSSNEIDKVSFFTSLNSALSDVYSNSIRTLVAALKCRQRKKAWLQSLQTKVELLTTDNDTLQTTVNNLTEEVNSLRAILAAHSNCPVAIANGAPSGGPLQGQQQGGMSHGPPPPHMQQNYAQRY